MTETQEKKNPEKPAENAPLAVKDSQGVRLSDLAAKRADNLRQNLLRRKAQTKARHNADTPDHSDDSATDR